jgi:peptidoglycan/LPS O-acetylase OafA/YrhL
VSPLALIPNLAIGLPPLVAQPNFDPSFWTLGLEVAFYVLAAVMTFALPRLSMEVWCLGWMANALAMQAVLPDNLQAQLLTCSGFAELFVLGAMSFRLLEAERVRLLTVSTWLVAAAIAFVSIEKGHLAVHVRYGVLALIFTAIVALAAKDWVAPLRWRPLVAVGQASYSLYLIHQILGFYVIASLERIGAPPLMAIALALVVAVCVALLLRGVVEAPGQRLVRGWLGLRKAPPMMPSSAVAAVS